MRLEWTEGDLLLPLLVIGEPASGDPGDERQRFTYDEEGLRLVLEVDPAEAKVRVDLHPGPELPPILRLQLHDCEWIEGEERWVTFAWSRLSEEPGPDASHAGLRIYLRPLQIRLLSSPPKRRW